MVSFNSRVNKISPYIPGKPEEELKRELGLDHIVKLASNESPMGVSPLVKEAILHEIERVPLYPDDTYLTLKKKLALRHGVTPQEIVWGNGSVELIKNIVSSSYEPGDRFLISRQSFMMYHQAVQEYAGEEAVRWVETKDYAFDMEEFIRIVREEKRIKAVFIANPNNPTGSFIPEETLLRFLENCPPETLVVMDEAYALFADAEGFASALKWRDRFPNLIVLETFSKAFGLAGLRVGYGIAHPEVASSIMKVRLPFHISRLSVAAALAALDDEEFLQKTLENNRRGKAFLLREIEATGFRVIPSQANFLLFLPPRDPIALVKAMERRGVIVRSLVAFGVPEGIRVTVGTEEQNNIFLKAFKEAVKEVYHG